jgi:3-hydroxyisobutyryl-CoA hydrolase
LAELDLDFSSNPTPHDVINNVIEEFATYPEDKTYELTGARRAAIDSAFSQKSVDEILQALEKLRDDPNVGTWAAETIQTIESRSPTSCKVAFHAYHEGRKMNIDQVFRLDMRLAATFCVRF